MLPLLYARNHTPASVLIRAAQIRVDYEYVP